MSKVWNVGDILTAADVNEYLNPTTRWAMTGSAQNVSNTTTLVDTGMTVNLAANATYRFLAYMIYASSTNTPDIKVNVTYPTGANCHWTPRGLNNLGGTVDDTGTIRTIDHTGTGSSRSIAATTVDIVLMIHGMCATAGSTGALTVQYAQNTATVENTHISANSWIHAIRVA